MLGPQILGGLLKKKVKMPELEAVSAQEQQGKAIAGNIANLPQAQVLAGQVNQFNTDELLKQISAMTPGFEGMRDSIMATTASQLKGEIPEDVAGNIYRSGVARALEGGYGGRSPRSQNLTARDLGLTSLALKDKGFDSLNKWMASTRAPTFDVTSMFISPQQQIGLAVDERDKKFQRDYGNNQLKAAQHWQTIVGNAIIDTDNQMMQMASSAIGSLGGMAMCWVAREVYGAQNPEWMLFREWMISKASSRRLMRYLEHGQKIAEWIKSRPGYKALLKRWMDRKIQEVANG